MVRKKTSKQKKDSGIFSGIGGKEIAIVGGAMLGAHLLLTHLEGGEEGGEGQPDPKQALRAMLQGAPVSTGEAPGVNTYNIEQPDVSFPAPADYSSLLTRFFQPSPAPTPSAGTGTGGITSFSKKTNQVQMFEASPVPSHYPVDVKIYAKTQYNPAAFLTGLRQEQANITALEAHPTLMLSKKGTIVESKGRTRSGEKTTSTFSTASYQEGYQARARTRYAEARKARTSKKESKVASSASASAPSGYVKSGSGYKSTPATRSRGAISRAISRSSSK